MNQPLRLKAADPDDLLVIAACLQDALVLIDDMTYLAEERRFILVANRFVWEAGARAPGKDERITTGLTVERVTAVKRRGIDRRQPDGILSLLTVTAAPGALLLEFSGGAGLRLEIESIDCRMADIGESWPTQWRPRHGID
jgi:hypothetical protein